MLTKTTALAIAVGLVLGSMPACSFARSNTITTTSFTAPSDIKGIIIQSQNNLDFPSTPDLKSSALTNEIIDITSRAKTIGSNAIFLQIRSQGEALYTSKVFPTSQFWLGRQGAFSFYDPLKQFMSQSKSDNIPVYVMIDPFYLGDTTENLASNSALVKKTDDCVAIDGKYYLSPKSSYTVESNLADIKNLWSKYQPAGVILTGIDNINLIGQDGYLDTLKNLITSLKSEIGANFVLGATITSPYLTDEQLLQITNQLDIVIASVEGNTNYLNNEFQTQIDYYTSLVSQNRVLPLLSPIKEEISDNELIFQSYYLAQQNLGVIYDNFKIMSDDSSHIAAKLATIPTTTPSYALNYKPDTTLTITHPRENYRSKEHNS